MSIGLLVPLVPVLILLGSLAGVVLLALGIRGRPVFSSPRCARCNYDLRAMNFMQQDGSTCPECGASFADPRSVNYARLQRAPRTIWTGAALLVVPWLLLVPLRFVQAGRGIGGAQRAQMTTPQLLAALPASVSQPWDWRELESRLKAGSLTTADVDAAINVLIADINAGRAKGAAQQPLHWSEGFLKAAIGAGKATPATAQALMQAYYRSPSIMLRKRARENEGILAENDADSPWDLPAMRHCWSLKAVTTADGAKLGMRREHDVSSMAGHPDYFSGSRNSHSPAFRLIHTLPPGEHELTFLFDEGTVAENATLRGIDGNPGTLEKWPAPLATWQTELKRKVTIVGKDEAIVTQVTDDARSPFKSLKIEVEQALVRPATNGVEIFIKWKVNGPASPPVSYRVAVRHGGDHFLFGTLFYSASNQRSMSSISERVTRKSLPPELKTIDLSLTPDPKSAERYSSVEEIWGKPLEIKDVPLERFDLAPATMPQ